MKTLWGKFLLAGVATLGFSVFAGCGGAVCGNGKLEEGEQCDDTNNNDGDGCNAVCEFEAPTTDFRLSELALIDPFADQGFNRFGPANILLDTGIQQQALNILIKFDSTVEGAAQATFGPGNVENGIFSFIEGNEVTANVIIDANGNITFSENIDIILPVAENLQANPPVFQDLPVKNASVSAKFAKRQLGEGGLFVDELQGGAITAQVAVADLCGIVSNGVNLLDLFDDGVPNNNSADLENCIPCANPADGVNCLDPDIDPDPNVEGDELYSIEAVFEAESVTIQ